MWLVEGDREGGWVVLTLSTYIIHTCNLLVTNLDIFIKSSPELWKAPGGQNNIEARFICSPLLLTSLQMTQVERYQKVATARNMHTSVTLVTRHQFYLDTHLWFNHTHAVLYIVHYLL